MNFHLKILWYDLLSYLYRLGVESAPAIVFLKETGVKPVVHHGKFISLLIYFILS